jgi:hypothetical protein
MTGVAAHIVFTGEYRHGITFGRYHHNQQDHDDEERKSIIERRKPGCMRA